MSISKRLEEARRAYARGDEAAAAAAHEPSAIAQAAEAHGAASRQYLGDMVYGGLDGIITTFAVVSGVAGASLSGHIVLILGMANLLADGFSMAVGAYLSAKSEREYYARERQRETWEVEHFPDGERAEMYQLYRQKGYDDDEARRLVEIKTRDPVRWVETMMVEELSMLPDERSPALGGLATLGAFVAAGFLPLLAYVLDLFIVVPTGVAFPVALALSGLALFGLGAAKAFVTKLSPWRSGIEMLLVGGLAAGVAYAVGALLKGIGA